MFFLGQSTTHAPYIYFEICPKTNVPSIVYSSSDAKSLRPKPFPWLELPVPSPTNTTRLFSKIVQYLVGRAGDIVYAPQEKKPAMMLEKTVPDFDPILVGLRSNLLIPKIETSTDRPNARTNKRNN